MNEGFGWTVLVLVVVSIPVLFIGSCMRYMPEYWVYQQEMEGKAEFAKAEQNRQIAVLAAKAKAESAKLEADAEVARATGAAKANQIMVNSLGNAENYLRWRYIMMLENNESHGVQREVIYTPAGGMFPITEAGRAVTPPAPQPQR